MQKIDYSKITEQFINFYYTSLSTDINKLINTKVLREYSCLKYNDRIYKGKEYYDLLVSFLHGSKLDNIILNFEFIDSGSRRIDILVFGKMIKNGIEKHFNQTFILCNHKGDNWYIKNSILMII